MTPRQWKIALNRVGMTIVGAANYFDVSRRQAQTWAAQGCKSGPATILMKLMLKGYVTKEQIEEVKK